MSLENIPKKTFLFTASLMKKSAYPQVHVEYFQPPVGVPLLCGPSIPRLQSSDSSNSLWS